MAALRPKTMAERAVQRRRRGPSLLDRIQDGSAFAAGGSMVLREPTAFIDINSGTYLTEPTAEIGGGR